MIRLAPSSFAFCFFAVVGAFMPTARAASYERVHEFDCATGCRPQAPLLHHAKGGVVGLTSWGGPGGSGVLYRFDGTSYTVLQAFGPFPATSLATHDGLTFLGLHRGVGGPGGAVWSWDAVNGYRLRLAIPEGGAGGGGATDLEAGPGEQVYFVNFITPRPGAPALQHVQQADLATGVVTTLHVFPAGERLTSHLAWQAGRLFGTTAAGPWVIDLADGRFRQGTIHGGVSFPGIGHLRRQEWGTSSTPAGGTFWYALDTHGQGGPAAPVPATLSGGGHEIPTGRDGSLFSTFTSSTDCPAGDDTHDVVAGFDPVTRATTPLHAFCTSAGEGPPAGLVTLPDGSLMGVALFADRTPGFGYLFRLRR